MVTATITLLVTGSASALAIPPVLGAIVDIVISRGSVWRILAWAVVLIVAGAGAATATWWGGRLLVALIQRILAELREGVFTAAVHLDSGQVEEAGSADVISRLTGDVDAVTEAGSGVLPRFVGALFTIVLTTGGLFLLDPFLALSALVAAPVQLIAVTRFLRRSRPLYVRLRREESQRGQAIIESVIGADTIRAHAHQAATLRLIAERSLTAVETQRSAAAARNGFNATLNLAEFAGLAAVLATGWWQHETGSVTVGAVTAAALFFHRLFGPIGDLLSSIDDLQRAHAGLERLVGVLRARPPAPATTVVHDASVRVRDVSYLYPAASTPRPALTNVTLTIPAGTCVALIGISGSGKTTLTRLIAGLATPTTGSVTIGGVPATQAASRTGRPAVLTVTQETHLFRGSLAENLRLGNAHATDHDLHCALEEVGAHWANDVPGGLDGSLSNDLDQHRIQQIALARVLLADPPVVILDEATAHSGTGETTAHALAAVARGRTTLIVAHRLQHTSQADLIVVLDQGRIVEAGTRENLLASHSAFRDLWQAQHTSTREEE
jgi:ABC-type multidrug transport system fused ATPase/permease subunit